MSDQYLAEIRIFATNFAPLDWALCQGQLLPISQYAALFSLLGTNYGGNGTSNFGLPNLQGIVPMFYNQGPGLSDYVIGETGGSDSVTVLATQLPAHAHQLQAFVGRGGDNHNVPAASDSLSTSADGLAYIPSSPAPPLTALAPTLATVGGSQPHNNLMPYLTLNFCIALTGIYPTRS